MILSRMLGKLGSEMFEACHGRIALTVLEDHPEMELAHGDVNVPGIDGLELVKRTSADPRAGGRPRVRRA